MEGWPKHLKPRSFISLQLHELVSLAVPVNDGLGVLWFRMCR